MKSHGLKFHLRLLLASVLATVTAGVNAADLNFDLLEGTPEGSWQLREEVTTDPKGRQTASVIRSSMLSSEVRDGKQYHWIEMVMDVYSVKNGQKSPEGERMIIKSLVPEDVLRGNAENVIGNLRAFGTEVIIQNGDQDPMMMKGSGGFMESVMGGMGMEINYDFQDLGEEAISTPAGTFEARKIAGTSSTTSKVMFTSINVESNTTAWMSGDVPFAIVKSEGETSTNGKISSHSGQLLEYGDSGATSLITKPPQAMPAMPNMKGLFGQ